MKRLLEKKGVTLIELVVTFAIASIFMVSAVALVSPAINIFEQTIALNRIHDQSSILAETIKEELTFATGYYKEIDIEGESTIDANHIVICSDKIYYGSKGGNPAILKADKVDGVGNEPIFVINYQSLETPETDSSGNPVMAYEESDWYYGKNFYRGNAVSLEFGVTSEKLIEVELTITNGSSSYKQSFKVDCVDWDKDKIEDKTT